MSNQLLADLRDYLSITWEDDALDRRITGLAERGIIYINRAGGKEYDFEKEGLHRQLLFDYVRYGRDDALDEWRNNFGSELRTLGIENLINYKEENNNA